MGIPMHTEPLDAVPLWGLFVCFFLAILLALDVGYRIGKWRHARVVDEKESPVGAMVASILGLLAFLLAFTFSLAASRFDERRKVVLEESNAMGTTYLRTRLLPEPYAAEASKLMREYVDVRLDAIREGNVNKVLTQAERYHELLWRQATAAAKADPHSITTGLFIQSLNDVIDIHAKRVLLSLRSRIASIIWIVLFSLAILALASVGYQSGLSATRRSPAMLVLAAAFAGVMLMIADLDRGREGFIRVSQESMVDLQKSMHAEPTP